MSDPTLALSPPGPFAFEPQERKARPASGPVLGTVRSAIVVGRAACKVRDALPDSPAPGSTSRKAQAVRDFAALFAIRRKLSSGERSQAA